MYIYVYMYIDITMLFTLKKVSYIVYCCVQLIFYFILFCFKLFFFFFCFKHSQLFSQCSSCDSLDKFSLSFLKSDCTRCCQNEISDKEASVLLIYIYIFLFFFLHLFTFTLRCSQQRLSKASKIILEFCSCNLNRYTTVDGNHTQKNMHRYRYI